MKTPEADNLQSKDPLTVLHMMLFPTWAGKKNPFFSLVEKITDKLGV